MKIQDVKNMVSSHGYTFIEYDEKRHYVIFSDGAGYYFSQSVYNFGKHSASIIARTIPADMLKRNLSKMCENVGLKYVGRVSTGAHMRVSYCCHKCGHEGGTTYNHIQQGHGCPKCAGVLKKDYSHVRSEFEKAGYILISRSYVNAHTLLEYECLMHPGKIQTMNWNNFTSGKRCYYCSLRYEENNHMWENGTTPIYNYLRNHLRKWKHDSYINSNGKCAVTNYSVGRDYVVHHIKSFDLIFNEVFEETGIEVRDTRGDYTLDEIKKITEVNKRKHNELLGAILLPSIHDLYHAVYGKLSTQETFCEFIQRYRNGEF